MALNNAESWLARREFFPFTQKPLRLSTFHSEMRRPETRATALTRQMITDTLRRLPIDNVGPLDSPQVDNFYAAVLAFLLRSEMKSAADGEASAYLGKLYNREKERERDRKILIYRRLKSRSHKIIGVQPEYVYVYSLILTRTRDTETHFVEPARTKQSSSGHRRRPRVV